MPDHLVDWWSAVEAALSTGQTICGSSKQFDIACEHISQLLHDASALLDRNSYATATFLAITALEEIAKTHIGMFRRSTAPLKRRKDPLFKHEAKHRLALGPTMQIGARLKDAVGEVKLMELIELARGGGFVELREASLYIEQKGAVLNSPVSVVPETTARALLLLAIEAFDDALVGYTDRSSALGKAADVLFEKWKCA